MKRLSVLFVMALLALVLPLVARSREAAGATSTITPLSITAVRATAVDPTTGQVFVSGDNKLVVLDADGGCIRPSLISRVVRPNPSGQTPPVAMANSLATAGLRSFQMRPS